MQLRDTGLRFSPITIVMHWIVAALLISIIGMDILIDETSTGDARLAMVQVQNLLGLILFVVSTYRFWARVTSYHPLPLGAPNPVEVIISRSVSTCLALAMVLLPIAAWLSKSAAGEVVLLPGGLSLPSIIAANESAERVLSMLYRIGATAFLMGLALHIFGALKNHFLLKNDALKRMLGKRVEL